MPDLVTPEFCHYACPKACEENGKIDETGNWDWIRLSTIEEGRCRCRCPPIGSEVLFRLPGVPREETLEEKCKKSYDNCKEIFELKRTYRSFSNKFPISYCPTLNDLIDPDLSMKIFGQENLESIEQIAKDNGISGTLPVALNLNVASLRDEDREVKAKHITALDSAMQYMIKLKETQEK